MNDEENFIIDKDSVLLIIVMQTRTDFYVYTNTFQNFYHHF